MLRKIKVTLSCVLILFIVSCGKGILAESEDETVFIKIEPTIMDTGMGEVSQADTRAKLSDSKFPDGSRIGLRLVAPTADPAISSVYDHFFGATNGVVFYYYLGNINTGDRLSGFSFWKDITVYGYHPYNNTITNLSAIPFRIATLNGEVAEGTETMVSDDHMVARPRKRDMDSTHTVGLPLKFDHIMTAIELYVGRNVASTPILVLSKVTFEILEGNREFTIAGKYNAIDPDTVRSDNNITASEHAKKIVISYPPPTTSAGKINSSNPYKTILLAMLPEMRQSENDYSDDATIKITFEFNDQDGGHYALEDFENHNGNPYVTFKLSDVKNTNDDNGLLAGWSYRVHATLGYYNKFKAPDSGIPHINYNYEDDADNQFVDI